MRRLILPTLLIIASLSAARAQEPPPSDGMMEAALNAAVAQRDQALNEGIRLAAQLSVAQREIARLRKELDEARKPPEPTPAEPAK